MNTFEIKDRIKIVKGDITKMRVDAVVNAANKSLLGGGGVDGAIHHAAGPELLEETKKMGGADTGEAKASEAYQLPAKYVIHTVGPVYQDGSQGESALLKRCYKNSIQVAVKKGAKTIAFPSISTGVYGYPIQDAAAIAFEAIVTALSSFDKQAISCIYFVVFDEVTEQVYQKLYQDYFGNQ